MVEDSATTGFGIKKQLTAAASDIVAFQFAVFDDKLCAKIRGHLFLVCEAETEYSHRKLHIVVIWRRFGDQ